ncbi:hypothetical protein SK128_012640, partial [Halocaridina rubra]
HVCGMKQIPNKCCRNMLSDQVGKVKFRDSRLPRCVAEAYPLTQQQQQVVVGPQDGPLCPCQRLKL